MRKVIFLQNEEGEAPGYFGEAFRENGWRVGVVEIFRENRLKLKGWDLAVCLGGPMSVHDDSMYPFLAEEIGAVKEWLDGGLPFLGICLGAQLLSLAAGGFVTRAIASEKGHCEVTLTRAGLADPIFRGFPATVPVFQWHEDACTIPPGGERLAESAVCGNQAFRIGNAVGLQFHLEMGRSDFEKMLGDGLSNDGIEAISVNGLVAGFGEREKQYRLLCHRLVRNLSASFLQAA